MVNLHVKRGEESQFLYGATVEVSLDDLIRDVAAIYNGRLKIIRICTEMEQLAKYGASLPPEMQGLSKDEMAQSELVDHWASRLSTADQFVVNEDPMLKRNGKAPSEKMAEVLTRTACEATSTVSNESVAANLCLTVDQIHELLDMIRRAITVVYPQGLPTHDPIRRELENREDIKGTQAEKNVINLESAQLWWAGKELQRGKKLADFVGRNEKTKIIVKLQKMGHGPPSREPVVTEEQRKQLLLQAHRRQQELQRLEADDDDDSYLNSRWADQQTLKRSFHGVENINWKPSK